MDKKLQTFPLFASLSAKTIDSIIGGLPRQDYKRGETIIKQGQPGRHGYLLFDGKVAVNVESRKGQQSSILFHSAPYIFGVIELWEEHPYIANVVATEPCSTLLLDRKAFLKMLETDHRLCINLVQLFSELIYQSGRDRMVGLFGQIEHLLANLLCYFSDLYGEEYRYGILIRREINKTELATILGVTRRSVIQGLQALENEKLIELQEKQLIIPDLSALRKKASAPIP